MIIAIVFAFLIFIVGGFGIINSKNIVKTIIALNISQTALILIFVFSAKEMGVSIPIVGIETGAMVDPVPQALIITAIVIGASTTALALMMSIKIFHYYGTLEWKKIFERVD
jgi:multicomponent Na+:H+ antiporter subunit C